MSSIRTILEPVLIEAMSYRVSHHSTSDDSFAYRAKVDVEEWKRRDNPITRFRKWLDANSFLLNSRKSPKNDHYLDQYGFSVDGPVHIPGLYNGQNKTFFLFTGERYREGTPAPLFNTTPTEAMRRGDVAEAQRLLEQLRNILENLQTARPNSRMTDPLGREMNQAMRDLEDMAREQQDLAKRRLRRFITEGTTPELGP